MIPYLLLNPFPYNSSAWWIWNDWQYEILGGAFGLIALGWLVAWRLKRKTPGPLTLLYEFNKDGGVNPYRIDPEQEGAAFLTFERANGDVEDRHIGQPFTFVIDDHTIERNHLNPRGSYDCLDPAKAFADYKPDPSERNTLVNETTQHIRRLRTGGYFNARLRAHLRMFVLIGILGILIGFGLAAAFAPKPAGGP